MFLSQSIKEKTMNSLEKSLQLVGTSKDKINKIVSSYGMPTQNNTLGCPRCGSLMVIAQLADGSKVKYCTKDRIAAPI